MSFNIDNIPNQEGKIAIVTGANIGLGFEIAKALAKKKVKVIMACRSIEKSNKAIDKIIKDIPNAKLETMHLDLSSQASIRQFTKTFKAEYTSLDLLINNAGVMLTPYDKTEDGFELQIGVNHLGHFLLTGLLLETMDTTKGARIISLSSMAHRMGTINFEDLQSEKSYNRLQAYNQSKLACLMFALELDRRLKEKDSNTISLAAHPGASPETNLVRHMTKVESFLLAIFKPLISHSNENGALPTLMAALHYPVKGGEYFGPTGFSETKGKPGKAKIAKRAMNKDVAKRLWDVSENLMGISYL